MSARYGAGETVRIDARQTPAHHRVPSYAKGQVGVIERVCDAFGQPETLAEGEDGKPFKTLYRVRIAQGALWPDYAGPPQDKLEIEIFEHWLEPAQ
jgi:nitrile hydratase